MTEPLEYDTYGLGDVVFFGNGKRMKILDFHNFLDIFLDNRVSILHKCLVSSSGWKASLTSMRWSIDSCNCLEADPLLSLPEPLASLSLREDSESSSTTYM